MKKCNFLFPAAFVITVLMGCGNSQTDKKDDSNSIQTKKDNVMNIQKITPNIWIETTDAKAAVDYYLSIFKDGKLKEHRKYKNPPEAGGGDFETAVMEINGMEFSVLAAGPFAKFNESVSFVINCKDQAEVDYYWNALTTNGGQESSCGWCKDKYGMSWQVVPLSILILLTVLTQRLEKRH
jgi:predicted 3-demethylubiquinone-9 3-methyltransferase (glyoxalase superfamily)